MAVLDARSSLTDGTANLPSGLLGMRFTDVSVAAPGGKAVLEGLDLTIAPGEAVALVGITGSGKSTLASLAARLADPDRGAVLAGSDRAGWVDLRRARLAEVRRRIQVVFQDSFLFSDSLAANLRRARPEATDDDLRAALDMASADEVLTLLNDGLASRIGERGVTLSGGQRQRLCLARALIARPAVLVADDSTSALDAVTERRILDRLRAMGPDRPSMLLIASKLSTILLADRVVLLDGGRIAASGSHEDLVAGNAAYRDLLGLDEAAA
jgi:ABC-type multidrug transport system fused ATPase/permease subunit